MEFHWWDQMEYYFILWNMEHLKSRILIFLLKTPKKLVTQKYQIFIAHEGHSKNVQSKNE